MMAAAMAIFMFSMAGIPPLAGFFGKLYVFIAAVNEGLYVLAIIGVLTSVIGAFYYRIVKIMYFDEPPMHLTELPGAKSARSWRSPVYSPCCSLSSRHRS